MLSSSVPLEIIVVDNKSTDDSADYIAKKFPEIKLIQSGENLGFAGANNVALNLALNSGNDYFFLLNQDAWVEQNTIENLIAVAERNKGFGILSPMHLTADKNYLDVGFRDYSLRRLKLKVNYVYEYLFFKKQEPISVRFVNAAAWLISRKCVEIVGGFDTILFKHYGEDNNYCQRVLFHKLEIGVVPSETICHDRADRVNKSLGENIGFSITQGNILSSNLKRYTKILLRLLSVKKTVIGFKEMFFIINNFKKIYKSRKINKMIGGGMEYILKTNTQSSPQ